MPTIGGLALAPHADHEDGDHHTKEKCRRKNNPGHSWLQGRSAIDQEYPGTDGCNRAWGLDEPLAHLRLAREGTRRELARNGSRLPSARLHARHVLSAAACPLPACDCRYPDRCQISRPGAGATRLDRICRALSLASRRAWRGSTSPSRTRHSCSRSSTPRSSASASVRTSSSAQRIRSRSSIVSAEPASPGQAPSRGGSESAGRRGEQLTNVVVGNLDAGEHHLGDHTFVCRKVKPASGDDPDLASYLRIEERELAPSGRSDHSRAIPRRG